MSADGQAPSTPWRLWKWPAIAYVVIMVGAMWVFAEGQAEASLPHEVGWLVTPLFVYLAVVSLLTGWAPLHGGMVASRKENPGIFWVMTAFYALCGVATVLMALGVFERLL